jgi:hypothetical protein
MKLKLLMDDIEKYVFLDLYFGGIVLAILSSLFFHCPASPYYYLPIITPRTSYLPTMRFTTLHTLRHTKFCYLFFFAVVYTIEFQKRGLPHVHLIL